ncbi:Reticulon-like protein [Actinidia chinensis var. chinensis]|uniref:Reticulon-like protein n=1 Tax=Actinidia chinensis var. chinensis TaxID=1590841 RepID=A0A2R6PTZ6_ACTCC|nr:Reticulon-like protein [Actinidia chinensis var. chinensis]
MPTPSSSSDSDDDRTPLVRPFGRQRPIRDILGGGKVADVLLWKDKRISAAILVGIGFIWFLFEVYEYNLLTLLCHIIISAMLVIFAWNKGAETFNWTRPKIPHLISDKSTFRDIAAISRAKLDQFLSSFFYVACGNDFRQLVLAIVSLWTLSVIGNYISTLNLLFFGCLCLETLPFLYDRYEDRVDYFVGRVSRRMRKSYKKLDREVLRKIPRGPVQEKKHK